MSTFPKSSSFSLAGLCALEKEIKEYEKPPVLVKAEATFGIDPAGVGADKSAIAVAYNPYVPPDTAVLLNLDAVWGTGGSGGVCGGAGMVKSLSMSAWGQTPEVYDFLQNHPAIRQVFDDCDVKLTHITVEDDSVHGIKRYSFKIDSEFGLYLFNVDVADDYVDAEEKALTYYYVSNFMRDFPWRFATCDYLTSLDHLRDGLHPIGDVKGPPYPADALDYLYYRGLRHDWHRVNLWKNDQLLQIRAVCHVDVDDTPRSYAVILEMMTEPGDTIHWEPLYNSVVYLLNDRAVDIIRKHTGVPNG